jgi:hypothetical protein
LRAGYGCPSGARDSCAQGQLSDVVAEQKVSHQADHHNSLRSREHAPEYVATGN